MNLDRFPFKAVASWLSQGTVVPFLGAAASRIGATGPTQLPDGRGLAVELVDEMEPAYPGGRSDDLAKVAQYFQTVFDRSALYEYLHKRFYQQQIDAPLARVAQLLAAMPDLDKPRFVMSTNYDILVERAFRVAERPLCVITQNMRNPEHGSSRVTITRPDGSSGEEDADTFQWSDPGRYPAGTTYLFKMHGSAHRSTSEGTDDLIITENDYIDFLVRNGGPMNSFFPPASLLAAFRGKRFLFLGYSLEDWNFRAFLRLLYLRNAISGKEQLRHWAIQLAPSELERELWSQRNVTVYDGDLLEFCERLEATWSSEPAS